MITIPVDIKECDDLSFLSGKQVNFTYAFHELWKKYHQNEDLAFCDYLKKKFKLNETEFRSLQSDVSTRISQTTTNKSDQEQRIVDLIDDISNINSEEKSNKTIRAKFKKHNKLKQLEKLLSKDITFGGKETLRELTKLYNKINVINEEEKNIVRRNELLKLNQKNIDEKTKEWKENRVLQFYLLGEANQKGNRFFDFDFANKTIIYKPYKGKKIKIKYSLKGHKQRELIKLQELINNKEISITISLSSKQICISFDNEIMSGFYINKTERTKETNEIKKRNLSKEVQVDLIKQIYKKHYDTLKEKKLENKIPNRFMAIDINPEYIGYCVADKNESGIDKIIEKGVIDLRKLNEKLNLSSDNPLVKRQNNKRKFEIQNAIKYLFEIVNHYKVAHFVKEDINNIGKNKSLNSKEANRKTKNIWHRMITEWQIEKRCISSGVELILINPVYTSFIGNMIYNNFDATNSAIEICRRGMFKYKKGLFYPPITGTISDTMRKLFEEQKPSQLKPRDAQIFKDCKTWVSLYKIAADNGLRWRWDWERVEKPYSIFRMNSVKSKVDIIKFI